MTNLENVRDALDRILSNVGVKTDNPEMQREFCNRDALLILSELEAYMETGGIKPLCHGKELQVSEILLHVPLRTLKTSAIRK